MKANLLFLNILHILNDGFQASFLLLLPFIEKDLSITLTEVGMLGGIMGLSGILLALPSSHIAAKYGGFKILVYALSIYAFGYITTSMARAFPILFLTFLLGSIGFGVFHPIAFALISKWSDKESRGRQMGNFTAIGDIGRIGIAASLTFIIAYIGWRSTSLLYGLVAILVFCYLYFFHISKNDQIEEKKQVTLENSYRYLLRHKGFLLASITGVLDSFASSSLFVFLPFLLLTKGIQLSFLGSFTAAFFIGNFVGKTLLGRFVDRYGGIKVFVLSEISMALLIVILSSASLLPLIIIVSIMLGALTKGTVPVAQTLVSQSVEDQENHEKAFGIHSLFTNIATTVSPILLGLISDTYGIVYAFYLSACFAVVATIPAFFFAKHKAKVGH